MPATAGRVRMPANNRVHSSAALQTHGIWQSAIGYDPYAPNKEEDKSSTQHKSANSEPEGENPYANFQGLLALARITGSNTDVARGACKRCGRVGHLRFQCRNFLIKEKDPAAIQADVMSELDKLKGKGDSDRDSEIERIISQRTGRRARKKDSSDDGRRKRKKEKRVKKDDSSDEEGKHRRRRHRKSRKEKRRRRSHRYSDDSASDSSEDDRHRKRKSRRSPSPSRSDGGDSDDSHRGRKHVKRSAKKSLKHHDV
uniref:CCHC-type domain-containing protein n=1 Tax=Cannabis sativa TaxID=3483 RepID=A0A803PS96_CANSA